MPGAALSLCGVPRHPPVQGLDGLGDPAGARDGVQATHRLEFDRSHSPSVYVQLQACISVYPTVRYYMPLCGACKGLTRPKTG